MTRDIEDRLPQVARHIANCARDGSNDEIPIVGHSPGATLAKKYLHGT
jgi:hypothetical protein